MSAQTGQRRPARGRGGAAAPELWQRRGVPRAEWGPPAWRRQHVGAIAYPAAPTLAEMRQKYRELWGMYASFACGECREHALQYLVAHPPDLRSGAALQRWLWTFHNAVNRRLRKPELSWRSYQRLYADEIGLAELRR